MAEVDPVSGLPKEEAEKSINTNKYNLSNESKAKADQLEESLKSETGQTVLNKIQEHLLGRVNKLIDEDPECKALKRLLIDMGMTINVGDKAIQDLMKWVTKRQTR